MFKIWARTLSNEKITKSFVYKGDDKYERSKFHKYLTDICEQMDIPTPVLLKSHIKNFDSFNITRFVASDFVESIDFDNLIVEYCRDDKTEKKHIYKAYLPVD